MTEQDMERIREDEKKVEAAMKRIEHNSGKFYQNLKEILSAL